jgi:hypothetical protein
MVVPRLVGDPFLLGVDRLQLSKNRLVAAPSKNPAIPKRRRCQWVVLVQFCGDVFHQRLRASTTPVKKGDDGMMDDDGSGKVELDERSP